MAQFPLWILCTFGLVAHAQYQFSVPNSNVADLTEYWKVGDTINITWQKGWYGVGSTLTSADLWVTWFRSDSYSQLLRENVTFDRAGFLEWKVNVSNDVVKTDSQFVLRLKSHSSPPIYTDSQNESPSRGFRLVASDERTTSTAGTSSTFLTLASSTGSTIPSTTISTTSSSATSTAAAGKTEKGANIGAIIGGVLGGLVIAGLLCIIALLLLKLAHKRKAEAQGIEHATQINQYAHHDHKAYPVEIGGREMPYEADDGSGRRFELAGGSRKVDRG